MSKTSELKVRFFYDQVTPDLPNRTALKKFIQSLFKKEGKGFTSLNYIFCSDEKLLQINRDFLQHDYYTDIITFDLSAIPGPVEGEIYISIDRVRENATHHHSSILKELHRVIFHGALHLCGYKDKKSGEIAIMRKMEDKYLAAYFK